MSMTWNDKPVRDAVQKAVMKGIAGGLQDIEAEAILLLTQGPKTGRVYRRRGVTHQASAPGEAPASDSGRLANSGVITLFPDQVRGTLSFATIYTRPLELGSAYQIRSAGGVDKGNAAQREFGTQSLEPRPFIRPAVANRSYQVQVRIAGEVQAALTVIGGVKSGQGSLF